jgi:hypothetical protein
MIAFERGRSDGCVEEEGKRVEEEASENLVETWAKGILTHPSWSWRSEEKN